MEEVRMEMRGGRTENQLRKRGKSLAKKYCEGGKEKEKGVKEKEGSLRCKEKEKRPK